MTNTLLRTTLQHYSLLCYVDTVAIGLYHVTNTLLRTTLQHYSLLCYVDTVAID